MPSLNELTRMRQTARERMPALATIKRLTKTADGYGGESQTYSTVNQNVPCRIDNQTQNESPGVNSAIGEFKISFPAGADVLETDQIEIDGKTYAVFGVIYQKSYEITRDVIVKKI
jgi:hypothetical protein